MSRQFPTKTQLVVTLDDVRLYEINPALEFAECLRRAADRIEKGEYHGNIQYPYGAPRGTYCLNIHPKRPS